MAIIYSGVENPVVGIKTKLVDHLLLFGGLLALVTVSIALFPITPEIFTLDRFCDFIGISLLLLIYRFRRQIPLEHKILSIITIVYVLYVTDALKNGLNSNNVFTLSIIPFVSILAFSGKRTLLFSFITLSTFAVIGALFVNGILETRYPFPTNVEPLRWVDMGLIVSMISILFTLFVYHYNKSIIRFISLLQNRNRDLRERDEQLQKSIEEKKVMIQEIHHRVKNNLAVVSGLMQLQSITEPNPELQESLQKSTNRIQSIAKVHEIIYETDDFNGICLKKFVEELSGSIISSLTNNGQIVDLKTKINCKKISVNHGVPLGIILNELITNSMKHGFTNGSRREIEIQIGEKDNMILTKYSDNGVGVPDLDLVKENGLGFTLIESLMNQLSAEHSYETTDGFELKFSFSDN